MTNIRFNADIADKPQMQVKRMLNGLIGKRYDKRKILTILLISTIRCVKIIVYTTMLCEI